MLGGLCYTVARAFMAGPLAFLAWRAVPFGKLQLAKGIFVKWGVLPQGGVGSFSSLTVIIL